MRKSLSRNDPELGDSVGLSRRIEMFRGASDAASLNMWGNGFRILEGIECDRDGDSEVGGSYLENDSYQQYCTGSIILNSYLAHIIKTLNFLTGISTPLNTSANLSSPLPLLVVHSGNTTTGLSAPERISSKDRGGVDVSAI